MFPRCLRRVRAPFDRRPILYTHTDDDLDLGPNSQSFFHVSPSPLPPLKVQIRVSTTSTLHRGMEEDVFYTAVPWPRDGVALHGNWVPLRTRRSRRAVGLQSLNEHNIFDFINRIVLLEHINNIYTSIFYERIAMDVRLLKTGFAASRRPFTLFYTSNNARFAHQKMVGKSVALGFDDAACVQHFFVEAFVIYTYTRVLFRSNASFENECRV